ncbi:MAG TPA: hypothetical protein VEI97_13775, partial [bacterium]|nr:hypothetical protein [bacterium]
MMIILAVLLSVGVVLGVGGMIAGWYGRRTDDHPLCRQCGFDLTGRVSEQCSECGADLSARKAIRVGHRVRRWWLVLGSGMVIGVCAFVLALGVVVRVKKVNLIEYAPMWWLEKGVVGTDAVLRPRAIDEVKRRMGLPGAGLGQFAGVLERVLDAQGDEKHVWSMAWGDLFIEAKRLGMVTDEQEKRFLSQMVRLSFQTRAQVREGASVPVKVRATVRSGSRRNYPEIAHQLHWRSRDGRSKTWTTGGGLPPEEFLMQAEPVENGETSL